MLKRFGTYSILGFLQPAIGIFILPLILSLLTKEDYGRYTLFYGLIQLANVLLGLKVNSILVAYWNNHKIKNILLRETLGMQVLALLATSIPVLVIAGVLLENLLQVSPSQSWIYAVILLTTGISVSLNQTFMQYAKLIDDISYFTRQSLTAVTLTLIFQVFGIYFFGLIGLFLGRMLSAIIVVVLNQIYLPHITPIFPNKENIIGYMKYVFPFFMMNFVVWVSTYIDRFFVRSAFSFDDLALHGLVVTVSGILGILIVSVSNTITPDLLEIHRNNDPKEFESLKNKLNKINLLMSLFYVLAVGLAFLAIPFLKDGSYVIRLDFLAIACFAPLMRLLIQPRFTVLMAEKKSVIIAKIEILGLFVFLILSISLTSLAPDLRFVYIAKLAGLVASYLAIVGYFRKNNLPYVPFSRDAISVAILVFLIIIALGYFYE